MSDSFGGIMVSLNAFYTFLIPQFIIVGIILQKLLVLDFGNEWYNLAKDASLAAGLFILAAVMTARNQKPPLNNSTCKADCKKYKPGKSEKDCSDECDKQFPIDKCDPDSSKNLSNLVIQYWVMVLIVVLIMIGKYAGLYQNSGFMTSRRGWGLLMEPIFYSIKSFIENKI